MTFAVRLPAYLLHGPLFKGASAPRPPPPLPFHLKDLSFYNF